MGMNIKSERAHLLAKDLANEMGTSVTRAVETALEEHLRRLTRHKEREFRYQRIRELVNALPPAPPGMTSDHTDLYDDWGLPK